MRAISMWQPWASLWLSPAKVHETRDWPVYKDWLSMVPFTLAVQAAKKPISKNLDPDLVMVCRVQFGPDWRDKLPMGAIIGTVTIISSLQMSKTAPASDIDRSCGYWHDTRYAWRRGSYNLLPTPIQYIGKQGIFLIPDNLFEVLP